MMNRFMRHILLEGASCSGSFEPREVLGMFAEQMTFEEYWKAEGFLQWICSNDLSYGHGNLEELYAQFMRTDIYKEILKKLA